MSKLPNHIRFEEPSTYSVETGSVDRSDGYAYRSEIDVRHFSNDDLFAIVAERAAREGTIVPEVRDWVLYCGEKTLHLDANKDVTTISWEDVNGKRSLVVQQISAADVGQCMAWLSEPSKESMLTRIKRWMRRCFRINKE